MKQTFIRLVLLLMSVALVLTATGCGKEDAVEINAPAVLQSLLEQVTFETELSEVGSNAALYFPGLPEGTDIKLHTGSGYYADEVAMLTLSNASDGSGAMKVVEKHIEELRSQYKNYVPEEVWKIDHAVTHLSGRHLFLCITGDYESASLILKNADDSSYQLAEAKTLQCIRASEPETLSDAETPRYIGANAPETQPDAESAPHKESEETAVPRLRSKDGIYHDYGTCAVRVDNSAFELYAYEEAPAEAYAKLVNRTADALADKTTVYQLTIPTAVGIVLPDDIAQHLPGYTDQGSAVQKICSKMANNVVTVNCFDILREHRNEYLYFRTDYHWNGKGAYYAYESFCETKGIDVIPLEEREEKQFSGFLGALYWHNSNEDPVLAKEPDTVFAYYPKSENARMAFTDKNGNTYNWDIIADVTNWKSSAKYSTFAGADNPFAVFTNPDVTDGSVCIVVKESYGNALLPYLVDHYSTVYEIDYRYWKGDLIDFAMEKAADDLLFANNLSMIRSNFLVGKLADIIR